MNLSDRSDNYLIKTYCHLINNVLPQANINQRDFPPAEMWVDVIGAIIKAINAVSSELEARKINSELIDCSNIKL